MSVLWKDKTTNHLALFDVNTLLTSCLKAGLTEVQAKVVIKNAAGKTESGVYAPLYGCATFVTPPQGAETQQPSFIKMQLDKEGNRLLSYCVKGWYKDKEYQVYVFFAYLPKHQVHQRKLEKTFYTTFQLPSAEEATLFSDLPSSITYSCKSSYTFSSYRSNLNL